MGAMKPLSVYGASASSADVDHRPLRLDVKFPILGFLMESGMTGYDLKRRFAQSVGFYYRASDGSLYPALKKLAREGLVRMREQSRGSRARKLYAITAAGRAHFLKMLAEPAQEIFIHDEGVIKLYFSHHLPKVGLEHLRKMQRFDARAAAFLEKWRAHSGAAGDNPFRHTVFELGRRIRSFRARMLAELVRNLEDSLATNRRPGNSNPARRAARGGRMKPIRMGGQRKGSD